MAADLWSGVAHSSVKLRSAVALYVSELVAQLFRERCRAAVEDVSDVELGVSLERGRDRWNDPGNSGHGGCHDALLSCCLSVAWGVPDLGGRGAVLQQQRD